MNRFYENVDIWLVLGFGLVLFFLFKTNRWIISGEGSVISNPASAWAVAKRDNPEISKKLWHHEHQVRFYKRIVNRVTKLRELLRKELAIK